MPKGKGYGNKTTIKKGKGNKKKGNNGSRKPSKGPRRLRP
jgi:hypothetical protein